MGMRNWLDRIEPPKDSWKYPIFEMIDTFLYTPKETARTSPHVRDALDTKRLMTFVVLATIPCILMALYNTGLQSAIAIQAAEAAKLAGTLSADAVIGAEGWRMSIMASLGGPNADSIIGCMFHGFLIFLPIYVVTLVAGGICEVLFASVRGHDVNEGFLVSSMLYTLIMPPDMPLYQVALGIIFGVVLGKEIFGGTGKNFLNPALTGRAFLFFTYPTEMSGGLGVWTTGALDATVDAVTTGATPLGLIANEGLKVMTESYSWWDAFLGFIPGSIGETSTLACLLGAVFLLATRIASFRIIFGVFLGMAAMSGLLNLIGSDTNKMFEMPFWWHLVTGGFAFGMVFMATDPVSAAVTNKGRWIFGFCIGVMCVICRVINPAYPEGMMLAILFCNLLAPFIDFFVMKSNVRRRMARTAA